MFKNKITLIHFPSYQHKGFTLIETFVAITVLMIAVLGPMTLLSRALQESRYLRDQMTASYLAQEGVELMIDNRNNFGDLYNVKGTVSEEPYFCDKFYWQESSGFNCDLLGEATNFKRDIEISSENELGDALEIGQYRIISTASYLAGDVYKSVTSSSIIFAYD